MKIDHHQKIAKLTFAEVYPLYVAKIERKGRNIAELNTVINWLTGFTVKNMEQLIAEKVSFEVFFERANLNPNAYLIKGNICGYKVELIENKLTQKIRFLDKLVDELAQGKKMEKIWRA